MAIFCPGRQIFLNYKNSSVGSNGTFFFCTVSYMRQNPPPWIRYSIQTGSIWGQLSPAICASCSRNYKHIRKCTKGHLRRLNIQWQELNLLSCGHGLAGSTGKIPSLPSFPTNLALQAFDCLCSAWTQVALRTRPDVLCLPWAGWTLNNSVQLSWNQEKQKYSKNKTRKPLQPCPNPTNAWMSPTFPLCGLFWACPSSCRKELKRHHLRDLRVPDTTCKDSYRNYHV